MRGGWDGDTNETWKGGDVTGIWYCKVGERSPLVNAADWPMRQAVAKAFREITGFEPDFIFSGWGAELEERERAVVENRLPAAEEPPLT